MSRMRRKPVYEIFARGIRVQVWPTTNGAPACITATRCNDSTQGSWGALGEILLDDLPDLINALLRARTLIENDQATAFKPA